MLPPCSHPVRPTPQFQFHLPDSGVSFAILTYAVLTKSLDDHRGVCVELPSPASAVAQNQKPETCRAYFAVVHFDPRVPGGYVVGMSDSQSKNGPKNFPGLCLSLEKARYLVVWSETMTERTYSETVQRTVRVNTPGSSTDSGTFNIYAGIYANGNYNGQSNFSATSSGHLPRDSARDGRPLFCVRRAICGLDDPGRHPKTFAESGAGLLV